MSKKISENYQELNFYKDFYHKNEYLVEICNHLIHCVLDLKERVEELEKPQLQSPEDYTNFRREKNK